MPKCISVISKCFNGTSLSITWFFWKVPTLLGYNDASKLGLGAILSNSNGQLVTYISRTLKPAETRYSGIDLIVNLELKLLTH